MMSKHGIADFWLAVALMLGLTACGGEQESVETVDLEEEVTVAKIEGEVFYRERMMLPPGAEVEVQLQDVSRADALAAVMETVMFKAEGGPPYAFIIHYDPADIDERSRYSLRATITHGDQLMFTSTEFIDPFNDLIFLIHQFIFKWPYTCGDKKLLVYDLNFICVLCNGFTH